MARTAGAPALQYLGILGALGAVVLIAIAHGVHGAKAWRYSFDRRFAVVVGNAALLNAYPGYFLLFVSDIVTEHVPEPLPIATALVFIYVVSGVFLEFLTARWPA